MIPSCFWCVLLYCMYCTLFAWPAETQVYPESAPMEHVLPDYLAEYMREKLAAAGVTAMAATSPVGLRCGSGRLSCDSWGEGRAPVC